MSQPSNVFKKIHAVMKDVEYLQKDDKVSFGNTSYKAISEEKVTSAIRQAMVKHGLVIIPVEQEHHKDGTLTTVNTRYQIVDVESGDSIIAVSSGTGADTQDKGVGKAMTYAYKYLLLRTFAIPTGDDPDKISSEELDFKQKQSQKKLESAKSEHAIEKAPNANAGAISEGQVKMLSELAKGAGYVKEDKGLLFQNVGRVVGRVITTFFELTNGEVENVASFLKGHKKGA